MKLGKRNMLFACALVALCLYIARRQYLWIDSPKECPLGHSELTIKRIPELGFFSDLVVSNTPLLKQIKRDYSDSVSSPTAYLISHYKTATCKKCGFWGYFYTGEGMAWQRDVLPEDKYLPISDRLLNLRDEVIANPVYWIYRQNISRHFEQESLSCELSISLEESNALKGKWKQELAPYGAIYLETNPIRITVTLPLKRTPNLKRDIIRNEN